jgi:hypothetical protein
MSAGAMPQCRSRLRLSLLLVQLKIALVRQSLALGEIDVGQVHASQAEQVLADALAELHGAGG